MLTKSPDRTIAQICVYTLLLTLIQHTSFTLAGLERRCNYLDRRPHPNGVCGSNLNALISTLCSAFSGGGDRSSYLAKRDAEKSEIDENMRGIMLSKKDAFSYLAKRELSGQNIVCECCYHQCNYYEMLQYCPLPGNRRTRSLDQSQANIIAN